MSRRPIATFSKVVHGLFKVIKGLSANDVAIRGLKPQGGTGSEEAEFSAKRVFEGIARFQNEL